MIMFLFLFALWLLLNGRVTLEICLFGVVVAGAVYAFSVYALGFHPSHEKRLLKRLGGYIAYAAVLIWEIIKANMAVIRVILIPPHRYHPAIVRVRVPLKKNISRVILSNSITLTPGTVTIEQSGDDFLVLCLDKENAGSIPDWKLTRMLRKMEGEEWNCPSSNAIITCSGAYWRRWRYA